MANFTDLKKHLYYHRDMKYVIDTLESKTCEEKRKMKFLIFIEYHQDNYIDEPSGIESYDEVIEDFIDCYLEGEGFDEKNEQYKVEYEKMYDELSSRRDDYWECFTFDDFVKKYFPDYIDSNGNPILSFNTHYCDEEDILNNPAFSRGYCKEDGFQKYYTLQYFKEINETKYGDDISNIELIQKSIVDYFSTIEFDSFGRLITTEQWDKEIKLTRLGSFCDNYDINKDDNIYILQFYLPDQNLLKTTVRDLEKIEDYTK